MNRATRQARQRRREAFRAAGTQSSRGTGDQGPRVARRPNEAASDGAPRRADRLAVGSGKLIRNFIQPAVDRLSVEPRSQQRTVRLPWTRSQPSWAGRERSQVVLELVGLAEREGVAGEGWKNRLGARRGSRR